MDALQATQAVPVVLRAPEHISALPSTDNSPPRSLSDIALEILTAPKPTVDDNISYVPSLRVSLEAASQTHSEPLPQSLGDIALEILTAPKTESDPDNSHDSPLRLSLEPDSQSSAKPFLSSLSPAISPSSLTSGLRSSLDFSSLGSAYLSSSSSSLSSHSAPSFSSPSRAYIRPLSVSQKPLSPINDPKLSFFPLPLPEFALEADSKGYEGDASRFCSPLRMPRKRDGDISPLRCMSPFQPSRVLRVSKETGTSGPSSASCSSMASLALSEFLADLNRDCARLGPCKDENFNPFSSMPPSQARFSAKATGDLGFSPHMTACRSPLSGGGGMGLVSPPRPSYHEEESASPLVGTLTPSRKQMMLESSVKRSEVGMMTPPAAERRVRSFASLSSMPSSAGRGMSSPLAKDDPGACMAASYSRGEQYGMLSAALGAGSPLPKFPSLASASSSSSSSTAKEGELSPIEIEQITNLEPTEWYDIVLKEGRISVKTSITVSKKSRVIYVFWNESKNKFYYGKTGDRVGDRLGAYHVNFNNTTPASTFIQDVRSHPTTFKFGIVHELTAIQDLDDWEIKVIKYKKKKFDLYNENAGGGGGSARSEERDGYYAVMSPTKVTPVKNYPLQRDEDGEISVRWTPGIREEMKKKKPSQELFYRLKNLDTDQRYIGSSNNVIKRGNAHACLSRRWDQLSGSFDPHAKEKGLVHPEIGRNFSRFVFGKYDQVVNEAAKDLTPDEKARLAEVYTAGEMEKLLILKKQSHKKHGGLNCNQGGGGPIARQSDKKVSSVADKTLKTKRKKKSGKKIARKKAKRARKKHPKDI